MTYGRTFSGTAVSEAMPRACCGVLKDVNQMLLDDALELIHFLERLAIDPETHVFDDLHRRLHADVRADQNLFQFIERRGINFFLAFDDILDARDQIFARRGDRPRKRRIKPSPSTSSTAGGERWRRRYDGRRCDRRRRR